MQTINKQYPIIDEDRKHYVRTPVQITDSVLGKFPIILTPGKWMAVDVVENGFSYLIAPAQFDTEQECQTCCDIHNRHHGWTEDEAAQIIRASIEGTNFKTVFKSVAMVVLILLSFLLPAQNIATVTVVQVMPDTICMGDTFSVAFKFTPPQVNTGETNKFKMVWSGTLYTYIWQGSYVIFYNMPTVIIGSDTCRVLKLKSVSYAPGLVRVESEHSYKFMWFEDCLNPVGIKEQEITPQEPVYFDLHGNRMAKRSNTVMIEQVGLKRRKMIIID